MAYDYSNAPIDRTIESWLNQALIMLSSVLLDVVDLLETNLDAMDKRLA